ncbi:MAG: purine-binding chemotaxis protein CheW [Phycisphaerales bacterium]|nr:purine-binding chemotaxis protein CheW [Phycisphaerales bacterium]
MGNDDRAVAIAEAPQMELGGKYLTFELGGEVYGVPILQVREIIRVMDITRVPHTLPYLRGVFNLRGKVIPVIDLRLRFGMSNSGDSELTCVIVVDVGAQIGVVVDEVREVHDIRADNISPPPEFGASVDTECLLGMGKVDGEIKILLDIDRVLGKEPFINAREAEATA